MKKLSVVLCVLCLLLVLVPHAQAGGYSYFESGSRRTWLYNSDGYEATIYALVDSRLDTDTDLYIPREVYHNGKWIPVTALQYAMSGYAYSYMPNLERVVIPYTVKKIGTQTFADCKKLKTVVNTDKSELVEIEKTAFARCSKLTNFDFQYNVTTIGASAFIDTGFTSVNLVNTKVTSIGSNAFANTNITSLDLPDTIQTIDQNAFNTKSFVSDVYYAGSTTGWASVSVGSGNRLQNPPRCRITIEPEKPTVTSTTSYTTTPSNAVIKAVFTASESGNWTKSGVRLYNASGTQIASKEEYHNYNMKQLSVWYDVNAELGKTLSPNTNYSFEIYTYFNGEEKLASRTYFKTDIKTELTWYNTVEEVTNNSFKFSLEGRANTTGTFSEYTFTLKDPQTGKQLKHIVNNSDGNLFVTGASWFKLVSVDTGTWGRLAQNHTYLYQSSYVFNGTRYYSDWYSVTTLDTWSPYMDKQASMQKLSNDKVDFWFIAYDGDKVQDVKCYVYNDVDGLDAKVQVDYYLETNEFEHWWWYEDNFWNPPHWTYHGKGTFDINDVGGRKDCYYYMQFVITDKNGNVTTDSTQAWYEQDPLVGQRIRANDVYPVTTKVDAAFVSPSQITLNLEGGDPYGVSGFRVAVYPETMTRDSAYWLDINEVSYKSRESINGVYHSIYTGSGTIDLNDAGFNTEENICVDVYTVQDLGEYQSLEPMSAAVSIDRLPPRFSDVAINVNNSVGTVSVDAMITDSSEIASYGIRLWDAENEDNSQAFGGSKTYDHYFTTITWDLYFPDSKLLFAQIYAEDVNQNYAESEPVLLSYGISNMLSLPGSLSSVDEEAFSGVSARGIEIPSGCVSIGSRAFAVCPNLRYVFIPRSVTYIAEDAFEGSDVVIVSPYSCFAQYFAQSNDIPWFGK